MAAAARRAGVKTMVAFNNIKTPVAMLAKQLIDRGEIGTPMRFRLVRPGLLQRSGPCLLVALQPRPGRLGGAR